MKNNIIVTAIIILVAILIFIFPVVTMEDKVNLVSKKDIESLTISFVNDIKTSGKLTDEKYNKFIKNLNLIGNKYSINLEFKILGKNSVKTSKENWDESMYYSIFTSQIEDKLEKDKIYTLKEGDIVCVSVKNEDTTFLQKIKSFLYNISGSDLYKIQTTQSGMVTTNGESINSN